MDEVFIANVLPISTSYILLPPANKVWGKVMFLHLSVVLFTEEGVL